jgi:hypothetical protein
MFTQPRTGAITADGPFTREGKNHCENCCVPVFPIRVLVTCSRIAINARSKRPSTMLWCRRRAGLLQGDRLVAPRPVWAGRPGEARACASWRAPRGPRDSLSFLLIGVRRSYFQFKASSGSGRGLGIVGDRKIIFLLFCRSRWRSANDAFSLI